MRGLRRLAFLLLLLAAPWLVVPLAGAFDDVPSTSSAQEKAAYILKFHRFATWPKEALAQDAPIVIGLVGAEDVAQELARQSAQRTPEKRRITTVQLQPGDSLGGIHILFIGNDQMDRQASMWLAAAKGQPILCITDSGNTMPPGSMINLVSDSDRTRFDVSLTAAEHAGIELSAALLIVAREVYGARK